MNLCSLKVVFKMSCLIGLPFLKFRFTCHIQITPLNKLFYKKRNILQDHSGLACGFPLPADQLLRVLLHLHCPTNPDLHHAGGALVALIEQ